MRTLALTAIAALGFLTTAAYDASAQGVVPPRGVTRYGDPICPSNYVFRNGMCYSIYGGGYRRYGYDDGYRRYGYGGDGYRHRGYRDYGGGRGYDPNRHPYGDAVPVAPGGRCPSNYSIYGGMCRPYRGY